MIVLPSVNRLCDQTHLDNTGYPLDSFYTIIPQRYNRNTIRKSFTINNNNSSRSSSGGRLYKGILLTKSLKEGFLVILRVLKESTITFKPPQTPFHHPPSLSIPLYYFDVRGVPKGMEKTVYSTRK